MKYDYGKDILEIALQAPTVENRLGDFSYHEE